MPARSSLRSPPWGGLALVLALLAGTGPGHSQCLDLNGNGLSDVWEAVYGAQECNPDEDSDGDGIPNRLEAIAGTDPFAADSVPRISGIAVTAKQVRVNVAGALGKRYQLQASEVVGGASATNWITVAGLVARTNPLVVLSAPADGPTKFFRVVISDVDTDGDGLNDWEEYQLGLDPLSATSNGQRDRVGKPMTDYQYVTNRLASQGLASLLRKPPALRGPKALALNSPDATSRLVLSPSASAAGSGLTGEYFTNSSPGYPDPHNFNPLNLFLTTNDSVIDFVWGPAVFPNLSNTFSCVRWTGQIQPEFSETYMFEALTDDGVKLWVNDQLLIDNWRIQAPISWLNSVTLQAGVRYDIRMEYFNYGGGGRAQLFWYSPSQPRQIIPSARLYPATAGMAPPVVLSASNAVAFLGQPFSYTIIGANSPFGYGASSLPPGLGLNPTNGSISGIPTLAGGFDIPISVTNAVGSGSAVLHVEVLDTGRAVTREVWLGVPGLAITNIPLLTPPALTNILGSLEGITNFGDDYGERIRGYLYPPVTGNYYFWLAANNAGELWISDDDEPANKVRRAYVSKSTAPRQWTLQPSQKSAWLSLEAGRRYYVEVLHKAGRGANDNWSVAWLLDPTGTNTVPGGVVPGYVLSRYDPPPISDLPGTLYAANLLALPGVASTAVGSASLRVSADGSQATLNFQLNNLSSAATSLHIDADPYLANPGQLIFDISATSPQPDGSYLWPIEPVGTLSAAAIVELMREGKASLNVHSVTYPAGEISGHFTLANGAQTFTPPPAPPFWTDDHSSSNAAARFLLQATFGPTAPDIHSVRSLGYSGWLNHQFSLPVTSHLKNVLANGDPHSGFLSALTFNTWWQESVSAPDQLRQRVAFALSEIVVVSENGILADNALALSGYYDLLLTHAFGNYRDLLKAVTLSPTMGLYLDMRGNDKGSIIYGTHPNENYAREIMQLFSIGLNRMWPDGSLVLDAQGELVPTYDQDVIIGYARAFTGWNYYQTNRPNKRLPINWNPLPNFTNAMVMVPVHHEPGTKSLLDHVVLPPAQGSQADSASTNYDVYASRDLDLALDSIFNHPNVGPFICRQLIQRLVTSHPSRDYLYRVVQKFNDNGSGVRGDLKAVVQAILLDYEARSPSPLAAPTYGKQREPLLRATALARAFGSPPPLQGSFRQNNSALITVTTPRPHRLSSSDVVFLSFNGKTAPASQTYYNPGVSNATTFVVSAPGVSAGTYNQTGTLLTVTNAFHGLSAGDQVYLDFTSGGAAKGVYAVAATPTPSVFTVVAADSVTRTGACLYPKWLGGYFDQSGTTITVATPGPHCLAVGNQVYVRFPSGDAQVTGTYRVAAVLDAMRFTIIGGGSGQFFDSNPVVLPLTAPPVVRSGSMSIKYTTWNMRGTDTGSSASLLQTPLRSPTVFNFFYPDFKFPGALAAAGLTTPEFQLTSDTSAVLQMNFLSSAILNNRGNTNGLSSFTGGDGIIALDFGPWLSPKYTSDAGLPALVDGLNTLLCGGQLSASAASVIVNYVVSRFPYSTPTAGEMSDRVRAVVRMVATSPEFTIQR